LRFSYGYLALSIDISFLPPGYFIVLFMWNKYFIAIQTARKLEKEIGILYSMLNTAFRVHCIYPKKEISLRMTK